MKTAQDIRRTLEEAGITVAEWARENGFQREIVAQVLAGRLKGTRGESHAVAVALGLKRGRVAKASDIKFTEAQQQ